MYSENNEPVLKQGLARLFLVMVNQTQTLLTQGCHSLVRPLLQSFTNPDISMTTQLEIPEKALQLKETQPFTALCFTTQATLSTLSRHVFTIAEDLYREANRLELEISGPVQWIYTGVNGDETSEFKLDIALPIYQPGSQPDTFSYQVFPSFRCAFYSCTGSWSEFDLVYDALFSQLYRDGYQNDGYVREVYAVIDLENPALCVTEIQLNLA